MKQLVTRILDENEDLFSKMQAAQNMHHNYTAGLLEHVWSMTRVAEFLMNHYSDYYKDLDPPLDQGVVMAAIILHDIGKLRELKYHPGGSQIHQGRTIDRTYPDGTRHGPRDRPDDRRISRGDSAAPGARDPGAPRQARISEHRCCRRRSEAILVNFVDELDAKMNMVYRQRMQSRTDDEFTDKVYGLDNRRIYKGIPEEAGERSEPRIGMMHPPASGTSW